MFVGAPLFPYYYYPRYYYPPAAYAAPAAPTVYIEGPSTSVPAAPAPSSAYW